MIKWLHDGRTTTVAWLLVFGAYIGFRVAKIDAPEITNAFVTITGIWVGNLGLSQTKKAAEKTAKVEQTAERAEIKADDALDRSGATMDMALGRVLAVQERELAANRAALQLMKDAIEVKQASGVPVLPETFDAVAQLEHQIELLAEDIRKRRLEVSSRQEDDHNV